MAFCSPEPYKRYAEEANWGDVVKMMQTIDRHRRLLMDEPVEGTDEEFYAHIKSNARPMPIGTLSLSLSFCVSLTSCNSTTPSLIMPVHCTLQLNTMCSGCTTATFSASIGKRSKSGSMPPRS
jgi:hypothetical protein